MKKLLHTILNWFYFLLCHLKTDQSTITLHSHVQIQHLEFMRNKNCNIFYTFHSFPVNNTSVRNHRRWITRSSDEHFSCFRCHSLICLACIYLQCRKIFEKACGRIAAGESSRQQTRCNAMSQSLANEASFPRWRRQSVIQHHFLKFLGKSITA